MDRSYIKISILNNSELFNFFLAVLDLTRDQSRMREEILIEGPWVAIETVSVLG